MRRYVIGGYELTTRASGKVTLTFDVEPGTVMPFGAVRGLVLPRPGLMGVARLSYTDGREIWVPDVLPLMADKMMNAVRLTVLWCLLEDRTVHGDEVPVGLRRRTGEGERYTPPVHVNPHQKKSKPSNVHILLAPKKSSLSVIKDWLWN